MWCAVDRLTRLLGGLLRRSARVLPAGRREWAEAVWAEVSDVPPGRRQISWVAGGLWLAAWEAGMVRRIGYWLGVAAVAALAARVVWLGWQGSPADPATEDSRILLIMAVVLLAGLPWVARRRGVFGPAGEGVTARVARLGGCAAICVLVLAIVRVAEFGGRRFEGQKSAGVDWAAWSLHLSLIAAYLAAILVLMARRPPVDQSVLVSAAACAGLVVMVVAPVQMLVTVYVAGILAVTARRSPVTPAALGVGAASGVAGALIWHALLPVRGGHLGPALVLLVVPLGAPIAAGLLVARRMSRQGDPAAVRESRIRQGVAAGAVTGAAGALLITILALTFMALHPHQVPLERDDGPGGPPSGTAFDVEMSVGDAAAAYEIVLVLVPLAGAAGGAIGGIIGTGHPRKRRPTRLAQILSSDLSSGTGGSPNRWRIE